MSQENMNPDFDDIWGTDDLSDPEESGAATISLEDSAENAPQHFEPTKPVLKHDDTPQRQGRKWMSPFFLIPMACLVLCVVVLGGVWVFLDLSQPQEPVSLLKPQVPDAPAFVQKKTESPFISMGSTPLVQEQTESFVSDTQDVSKDLSGTGLDTSGAQSELDGMRDQVKNLAALLENMSQSARESAAIMRGEGMASISEADLQALLMSNSALQQQLENARNEQDRQNQNIEAAHGEIDKLHSQNENLSKKLSESQRQYAALQSKGGAAVKRDPAAKPQPRPSSNNGRNGGDSRPAVPSKLPFEVHGITEHFAVIKDDKGYQKWDIGTTMNGVTLTGINTSKQSINTSIGQMKLKGAK